MIKEDEYWTVKSTLFLLFSGTSIYLWSYSCLHLPLGHPSPHFHVICFVYHFVWSPTDCSCGYSCEAIHWNTSNFSRLHHWRQWLLILWQPSTAFSSPAELCKLFLKLLLKGGSLSIVQLYESYCRSCEFMRVILLCLWHCPCPFFSCSLRLRVSNMVNHSAIPSQNHDPNWRQHESMGININRRKFDNISIEQNEGS